MVRTKSYHGMDTEDMKPIFTRGFWKERIDTAREEHYSVYVCNKDSWRRIESIHRGILSANVRGMVLDAGCAYGRFARYFDPDEYVGVDLSEDFINCARERNPDYRFIHADLRNLPFRDGEFEWSFCVSIRRMVERDAGREEWQRIERELKRVSKKVLVLEYEGAEEYEIL